MQKSFTRCIRLNHPDYKGGVVHTKAKQCIVIDVEITKSAIDFQRDRCPEVKGTLILRNTSQPATL